MSRMRLKPFPPAFSYSQSALGRIQPALFAQQREFWHPHHPALSQTWLLALASRQNRWKNLIALLRAGCPLARVGHLQRSCDACWMPGARLSTLSTCFSLHLPKLRCHRDVLLKGRGSTRFTRVPSCSLERLCSLTWCRDATTPPPPRLHRALKPSEHSALASGANEAPTCRSLVCCYLQTARLRLLASLPPLLCGTEMPCACCGTDFQTCGRSAILIFLYLPAAVSQLRGTGLQ